MPYNLEKVHVACNCNGKEKQCFRWTSTNHIIVQSHLICFIAVKRVKRIQSNEKNKLVVTNNAVPDCKLKQNKTVLTVFHKVEVNLEMAEI